MTKIDWSKTSDEKKLVQQGWSTAHVDELPISWEERAGIPEDYGPLLERFVRSVFVADINQTKLPPIPRQLRTHIQDRVERRGGVLEFAKALADYDRFRESDARKKDLEKHKNKHKAKEALLRRIAKYELGVTSLEDVLRSVPDALRTEISEYQDLTHWAKSQPEYAVIRRQNARKLRRRTAGG